MHRAYNRAISGHETATTPVGESPLLQLGWGRPGIDLGLVLGGSKLLQHPRLSDGILRQLDRPRGQLRSSLSYM